MQRISWIGVGIMGKAMVRNLMKRATRSTFMPVTRKKWQTWYPRVPYPTAALRSA